MWRAALGAAEGFVPVGTPYPFALALGVLPVVGATGQFKDVPWSVFVGRLPRLSRAAGGSVGAEANVAQKMSRSGAAELGAATP